MTRCNCCNTELDETAVMLMKIVLAAKAASLLCTDCSGEETEDLECIDNQHTDRYATALGY